LAPFLRFVLALVNVGCGYLAVRALTRFSLPRVTWLLVLLIDGAFFKGLSLAAHAVRLGAASLPMALLSPLVVGLSVMVVLVLAQPPTSESREPLE